MTQTTPTPAGTATTPPSASTARLLACGMAAGPVFVLLAGAQVLTRDGFDLTRHAISMLSLGDLGWIQISNFVVTGLLVVAAAVGMRRVLRPGRGARWVPRLLAGYGIGLITAGFFVTDPWRGFPVGAPEPVGGPSWHGLVHDTAAALAFDLALVACIILIRRFLADRSTGWAAYSAATALAVVVLTWWPDLDGITVRMAAAAVVLMGWICAITARLRADLGE